MDSSISIIDSIAEGNYASLGGMLYVIENGDVSLKSVEMKANMALHGQLIYQINS